MIPFVAHPSRTHSALSSVSPWPRRDDWHELLQSGGKSDVAESWACGGWLGNGLDTATLRERSMTLMQVGRPHASHAARKKEVCAVHSVSQLAVSAWPGFGPAVGTKSRVKKCAR